MIISRMSAPATPIPASPTSSGTLPVLLLVQGSDQTRIPIERTPFSVGRKTDKELVLADPRVSRDHAQILLEG